MHGRMRGIMAIEIYSIRESSAGRSAVSRAKRIAEIGYDTFAQRHSANQEGFAAWMQASSRKQEQGGEKEMRRDAQQNAAGESPETDGAERPEASRIYEAVMAGKGNPLYQMRTASNVPYGHLAKDGVIVYNGIVFTCDEQSNSICLGNMEDKSQVITVALSGGGYLKVNRKNIGDLSRAAGMFSPKDLNLIMRAIIQDTKIQSMQKEIDDMKNSIGTDRVRVAASR